MRCARVDAERIEQGADRVCEVAERIGLVDALYRSGRNRAGPER